MTERLQKQWDVTKKMLAAAAVEVGSGGRFHRYIEYLEHNELELALDQLMEIGDEVSVTPEYWWNLKKAAEIMGLESHYGELRERRRQALASANHSLQGRRP